MAGDYIPGSDAEFNDWQQALLAYVAAHLAALGLVAADLAPLTAAQSSWVAAYAAHLAGIAAAAANKQQKDHRRRDFEGLIRPFVRALQVSDDVDDGEKANMGITVADTTATAAAVPTTTPALVIDTSVAGQHTINFADSGTPTKKAKPKGVEAVELYYAIRAAGAAGPTTAAELTYLASDSSTPYLIVWDGVAGADTGKVVWYRGRWLNSVKQRGPWGAWASATIG